MLTKLITRNRASLAGFAVLLLAAIFIFAGCDTGTGGSGGTNSGNDNNGNTGTGAGNIVGMWQLTANGYTANFKFVGTATSGTAEFWFRDTRATKRRGPISILRQPYPLRQRMSA